jgi:cation diffusion facilitator family transporter
MKAGSDPKDKGTQWSPWMNSNCRGKSGVTFTTERKKVISAQAHHPIRPRLTAISLSLIVGIILMAAKFYVYRMTHSSAVLSDALESIINVAASAFAFWSILLAARPPDESHPYGHGKIEYFSAGFEGALIILAAIGIFKLGVSRIIHPHPLPQLGEGLMILLAAGVVNLILGMGLIRAGRRTESLTLFAEGKHVLTDVYTSGALLLGLFLIHQTGWYWLDGTIACLVGLNILFSGAQLVRQSFSGLMDAANPELLNKIAAFLVEHRSDLWIDIHKLRAWRSGDLVHMDLHLILPRDLTLEQAHHEGEQLEQALMAHFQNKASILIHLDPCVNGDCPICNRYACGLRTEEMKEQIKWDLGTLTHQKNPGKP